MLKHLAFFGGILLLSTLSISAKDYRGAELFSKNTVKYGRFDVRMKAVSGSGIVSSFFLYYDNSYLGSPEPWQEIDIEVLGKDNDVLQSNIITGVAKSTQTSEILHNVTNLSQGYHTYSVEWTPDYIAWYFDGNEVRRSTDAQVVACQQKAMSYRFNLWISSDPDWVGPFNPSILPVYQFINWVKFSKYTPGSGVNGTNFTPEWQDDFNSFNSSRWGKGDWTFEKNLVDFTPNNIVVKDGYCVICLTSPILTGFYGTVPQDLETSVMTEKPDASLRILNSNVYPKSLSVSVGLDGRLIKKNPALSNGSSQGMLITRENDGTLRKIGFLK